uniref:Polymerase PA n=1 Tax=Blattodean orthomyxo-related virus OKIAV181 TaxID=2746285 RepID=A0A7D7IKH5_9ORTO|nr:polymerase PA [Blattodean orthomyxo-related virus OKIAV181]
MDVYKEIIYDPTIYNQDLLNTVAVNLTQWENASYRKKELIMRHLTTCVLLGNTEMYFPKTKFGEKRRKEENPHRQNEPPSKKHKFPFEKQEEMDIKNGKQESGPSQETPSFPSENKPNTLSDKTTTSSSEFEIEEEEENNLRVENISIHPSPEFLTAQIATKWNCHRPSHIYDLADHKNKVFIKVQVGGSFADATSNYQKKTIGESSITALAYVTSKDGNVVWVNFKDNLRGEDKVKSFLIKRSQEMEKRGIMESTITESTEIIQKIFCSPYFNAGMDTWINDWLSSKLEDWSLDELYPKKDSNIKTIKAKDFLNKLSTLTENSRKEFTVWKGKIIPDPIAYNIHTTSETDKEMVDEYITFLTSIIEDDQLTMPGNEEPEEFNANYLLKEVMKIWENSSRSTFEFLNNKEIPNHKWLSKMLGFKVKKIEHNDGLEEGRQKYKGPNTPCKYHLWMDFLISQLNQDFDSHSKKVPYINLLEPSLDDNHPLGVIANKTVNELWKDILQSNSAIFSSKMTGFYSRLGGAYGQNNVKGKNVRDSIAIFPIYSTVTDLEKTEEPRVRIISGICLRGPTHARCPTDRIPIITIETVNSNPQNRTFCKYIRKAKVIQTKEKLIVIRQNSIMREDTSYLTFNINSIFLPTNLFGTALLEDPQCPQSFDVLERKQELLDKERTWFRERFTEGILMAAIGNSRDEGYFACLRKIFLVLFNWKRGDHSATWDLDTFCKKTNDCLVDNPLSMHFHRTLLEILRMHSEKEVANTK